MRIAEVLDALGVPYACGGDHRHVTDGHYGVDCPQCSPGAGSFKLGISERTLYASCWSCGRVRLAEALVAASGRPWREVLGLLGEAEREYRVREARTPGRLVVPPGVGEVLPAHANYLRGRRIDPDAAQRLWGVKGIGPDGGRLRWRLWLPVTLGGKVVSWTTRGLTDREPRYVNAKRDEEAIPAKTLLAGEEYVRGACVVVEGPLDAMRVGPGAVSLGGLGYSRAQVRRLARIPVRAVVFDSEPEAQRRARALCGELEVLPGRTVRVELDAADPGSAGEREIRLLRKTFLD